MRDKTDHTTHCAAKQIYDVDESLFANNQRYIAAVMSLQLADLVAKVFLG
ncbi:hypothetical protein GWE18_15320 [Bradyrhizobium sp. CSA112]|nr:hypothetical protein [Bradyrhizobium sp. CSA112]MDE5454191.1 hypothetical protein [Bradyrhizobium sp. CSA112]